MPDEYEIGQQWWDYQQQWTAEPSTGEYGGDVLDFWNDLFEPRIGSEEAGLGINAITSMFASPAYFQDSLEFPGYQMYQATESKELQSGLLANKFQSSIVPEYTKQIGSTGFASSGISQPRSIYDQYLTQMGELEQEEGAAIEDVLSGFGSSLQGQLNALGASGGFSEQFAGGDANDPFGVLEDQYDWTSLGFEGSFQEQLEGCVTSRLNQIEITDPSALFEAVEYCKDIGGV